MNRVDVIGIGAINFDFIFQSKQSDYRKKGQSVDDGEEIFIKEHVFADRLDKLFRYSEFEHAEVGGSALLAIRTTKAMCSQLRTAYVGVYGSTPKCASGKNVPQDANSFEGFISEFVDDTSWLFRSPDDNTGCALVKMHKHRRQFIHICSGANNSLWNLIEEKGVEEFIVFLASARWIHLTSLQDIFQFKQIADCIVKAKKMNPSLIVSIDPGYDYTKNHKKTLTAVLSVADYVFLNRNELSNISANLGLSTQAKIIDLGTELIQVKANPQVIIVKGARTTKLMSLINNKPYIRTYHHIKLSFMRILNDTGAGDAFAGGFIAGMLSPLMLSHQPAPIHLASIAAAERLKSLEWPTQLKQIANDFYKQSMSDEELNLRQLIKLRLGILKNPVIDFFLGIVVGLLTNLLWDYLVS